jgi:hydrogenase-4 membrane subunit HyfE
MNLLVTKIFFSTFLILSSFYLMGQSKVEFKSKIQVTDSTILEHFMANVTYSKEAKENRTQGLVVITFLVDITCSIK